MKKYNLKGANATYLITLFTNPDGITAANLAEMTNRDKAEISRAVGELEKNGFIKREIINKNSYRALLKLTPKGVEAAQQIQKRAMIAVETGGHGIGENDRECFYNCLLTIADNLKNASKEGLPE